MQTTNRVAKALMVSDACLDVKQAHNTPIYVTLAGNGQVELRLSHRNDLRLFLSVEALKAIVAFAEEVVGF